MSENTTESERIDIKDELIQILQTIRLGNKCSIGTIDSHYETRFRTDRIDKIWKRLKANDNEKDKASGVRVNARVSCLTIPQREKIADMASDLRWEELRELGVYDKGKFTPGDVDCVLKALIQELNS